jgi:hypothetical protein
LRKSLEGTTVFRLWSTLARVSATVAVFTFASSELAQQALYPQHEGIVQPLHGSDPHLGGSLYVATIHDGVYSGAGANLIAAPTGGFKSDDIGSEFDASAKNIYRKSFVTNYRCGPLFPGEIMTIEKHGAPLTYAYLGFTYRFKFEH